MQKKVYIFALKLFKFFRRSIVLNNRVIETDTEGLQGKTLNPDVNKSPDATRIMQEVNEAYRVLNDRYLRLQYDKEHFSTTTATEDPYPDWDDCCDAHSESDGFDPMRNWRERTKGCYEWPQQDDTGKNDWIYGLIVACWILLKLFNSLF